MKVLASVYGAGALLNIVMIGRHNNDIAPLFTFFWCLLLLPVGFMVLQESKQFEGRTPAEIGTWKQRSWALYGDVFLAIAITVAKYAWLDHQDELPSWATTWWWSPLMVIAGFVFGSVFREVDNRNYDPLSLQGPAKWAHDRVFIPVFAGALFARAVPLLWHIDMFAIVVIELVACWVLLAVIDGLRMLGWLPPWTPQRLAVALASIKLDPEQQHPRWDAKHYRFVTPDQDGVDDAIDQLDRLLP
jgi:hypothetical protein